MKLIIDISDKTYEIIRDMMYFYNPQRSGRAETKEIITAIKNGTPLEEEFEQIKEEMREYWEWCDEELQAPSLRGVRTILDKHIDELKGE